MILLLPPKDMNEVMDSFGDCKLPLKESAFGKMSVKEQLLAILGRAGYKESNAGNDVQGNSDELLRTIYQHRVALMKAKKADKVKAIKEAVMAQYSGKELRLQNFQAIIKKLEPNFLPKTCVITMSKNQKFI